MTDETSIPEELAETVQFAAELRPRQSEAGAPTRVTVENQSNVPQVFTLTWRSLDDGLVFEPVPTQQLHVPPGEVAMAEFSANPRNRPLFGADWVLPFTTHVQAAGGGAQNLNGEVVGKALIPTWVPIAVLALLLACACLCVAGIGLVGVLDQPQPAAPMATAVPSEPGAPAAPVEPPPEQPAEQPPEQPAEPPAEQPAEPPSAGQLPAEEGTSGLPCAPAAGGLLLAPLLVMGKKHGIRQRSNK